jgi:hypothetical protein
MEVMAMTALALAGRPVRPVPTQAGFRQPTAAAAG